MVLSFMTPFINCQKSKLHPYDPVPASDEEMLRDSPDGKETRIIRTSELTFDTSFWLTALAVLSITITFWNLIAVQLRSQELYPEYLEASFARPYNGLEKIPRNESSPLWPLSSIHYPDFVGATEGTIIHHTLHNGSVVRLDPERRVILQHRVRDYGLENCAVKVEFSHSAGKQNGHAARAYGYIGEDPYLTLWRVLDDSESRAVLASSAVPTPLPSRREFLGNITVQGTHASQSPFFRCDAGSVQTLEIAMACASDPCVMEFRLTQSPKRQGFWMIQSE